MYPKLSHVIDETRITYNTLLEDIPVVENYQLRELDMQKYLVIANNHITYLVDVLTVGKNLGKNLLLFSKIKVTKSEVKTEPQLEPVSAVLKPRHSRPGPRAPNIRGPPHFSVYL